MYGSGRILAPVERTVRGSTCSKGRLADIQRKPRHPLFERVLPLVDRVRRHRANGTLQLRVRRPHGKTGIGNFGVDEVAVNRRLGRHRAAFDDLAGMRRHRFVDALVERIRHANAHVERATGEDAVNPQLQRLDDRFGTHLGLDALRLIDVFFSEKFAEARGIHKPPDLHPAANLALEVFFVDLAADDRDSEREAVLSANLADDSQVVVAMNVASRASPQRHDEGNAHLRQALEQGCDVTPADRQRLVGAETVRTFIHPGALRADDVDLVVVEKFHDCIPHVLIATALAAVDDERELPNEIHVCS